MAKTRLVPPLSENEAAALAACLAQDTVANAQSVVRDVLIAYAPTDARLDLEALLPANLRWFEQEGDDLGQRLDSVAAHAFSLGFSPFIFLGADSPTLPTSFITQAFDSLTSGGAEIVMGPTEDGGYYLVGLHKPAPGLFDNIDWSTASAYQQIVANAARLKLRLRALAIWYDIDMPTDLSRLRAEVIANEQAQTLAPNTYRWLLDCSSQLQSVYENPRGFYRLLRGTTWFGISHRCIKAAECGGLDSHPVEQLHGSPAREHNHKTTFFKTPR